MSWERLPKMATSSQPLSSSLAPPADPRSSGTMTRVLATPLGRVLVPSLSDLFFVALFVWLFLTGDGWHGLLVDGDCGWHIRTGEYILDHGRVPVADLFSFSKAGQPWFAWEWLSDVLMALLFRAAGLKGIVLAAGVVIVTFSTLLLRRLFAQGANLFCCMLIGLLAVGAGSIHFLARPHVFTLLLVVVSQWLIEADRARPSARIWALVPLTALWANLHGGFLALFVLLGLLVAGTALETLLGAGPGWRSVRRYTLLMAACALASILNPYGLSLHRHIVEYLRSDWIRNTIQEFQSPSFRSENMVQFEVLLMAGILVAAFRLSRRDLVPALWILAFAHMALTSARHVPLYAIVAAPAIAGQLSEWWRQAVGSAPRKSVVAIVEQMGRDLAPGFRRNTGWVVAAVVVIALQGDNMRWPKDFPEFVFPVRMVGRFGPLLAGHRVLSYDQWGDYLIFKNPKAKVFVDGRSDFYGPSIGNDYLRAQQGSWEWKSVLEKYAIDVVLAPPSWALVSLLKSSPEWRLLADDGQSVLLEKIPIGGATRSQRDESSELRF